MERLTNMSLGTTQLRIVSAAVMLVVVGLVLLAGPVAVKFLVSGLFAAMIAEWLRLLSKQNKWPQGLSFYLSLGVAFIVFVVATAFSTPSMVAISVTLGGLLTIFSWKKVDHKWMAIWPIYIAISCSLALALYLSYGPLSLLWLLVIVWATDIGAYFVGRSLGGPKLMPKVSPKKTLSGAAGGVISAILASLLFVWFFETPSILVGSIAFGILLAVVLSVVAQAGDLLESFAKRQHNIKDSSQLIPGHGGVLDRLDGLLPTIPVAFIFLSYLA